MLNTVLFDMGGTLEDIWNNQCSATRFLRNSDRIIEKK